MNKSHLLQLKKQLSLDKQLFAAVQKNNSANEVLDLIKQGANVNAFDPKTGHYVIHDGASSSIDVLKALVYNGANVNALTEKEGDFRDYNYLPFHISCFCGNEENIDFLLSHGSKTNVQTALFLRAPRVCASQQNERLSIQKLLNKHNVPLNIADFHFNNELFETALSGDNDSVLYLYNSGSRPIVYNTERKRFHRASQLPHLQSKTRKLLIEIEKDFVEKVKAERQKLSALQEKWLKGEYETQYIYQTDILSKLSGSEGRRVVVSTAEDTFEGILSISLDGWKTSIKVESSDPRDPKESIPLFSEIGQCTTAIKDLSSGDVLFENENACREVPVYEQIAETLGVCYALDYISEKLDSLETYKDIESSTIKGSYKS